MSRKRQSSSKNVEEEDAYVMVSHEPVMPGIARQGKGGVTIEELDFDDDFNQSNSYVKDGIVRDSASSIFSQDYTFLHFKKDHSSRPLWVCHDGRIILEAFSPLALQAQDFLITISEPVSRPSRMHEYKLNPYSLYAAVAVGMETNTIIEVLDRFSKVTLPEEVTKFIRDCTFSYGKVRLVLKQNRYFIESSYPKVLRQLLLDDIIKNSHLLPKTEEDAIAMGVINPLSSKKIKEEDAAFGAVITLDREDEVEEDDSLLVKSGKKAGGDEESDFTSSFEIEKSMAEDIRRRCAELDYPLMEEYDFRNDTYNATLDIDLSPKCIIRDYQEKSLSKMFGGGGGRARSGIIVLPTFAGDSGIVITSYTMIAHSGRRSQETTEMLKFINSTEWGLMILDEVHVVPANVFRRVLTTVAAHTKLGLTATLVREDDKIEDLNFLIGPKLFEANWMDLAGRGHIAKVEATEIWCPMSAEFYKEYLASKPSKQRLLCVMNPFKVMACQYLIREREEQGDKIIVFSDNVFALKHYATLLRKPMLYGATSHEERSDVLKKFREGKDHRYRTIFLSKVGDTSLDLPEATCLIQISSQFGSRRQEAQRMGRILRAKRRNEEGFRSRFFTLVSRDTAEVAFSSKRKRFLIDQGYEFKVIPHLTELIPEEVMSTLYYNNQADQVKLLQMVKAEQDSAGDEEQITTSLDDIVGESFRQQQKKGKTDKNFMGGDKAAKAKAKAKLEKRHPLFKNFYN